MKIALAAALFGIAVHAMADQPMTPYPAVFTSPFHGYYFRLIPGPSPYFSEQAKGEMYRVAADKDELMYTTAGWYSFSVLVSMNGESLVRHERTLWGPYDQELAIAFYSKGALSSQYMLTDLVENLDCVKRFASYDWSGPLQRGFSLKGEIAGLETYDGQSIVFDMKTGRILEKRRISAGCSRPED